MILGVVIPTWSPDGKNGDPQTGWMKEGVLEQRGCSFQVDKINSNNCPQSGVNLYCVRCSLPKLVSAFRIIKGPHLRGES